MLFKKVNHFSYTANAANSILNNAVDLYDKQSTIVGFRQAKFQHRSKSSRYRNPKNYAGIWRHPTTVAGFRWYCARSSAIWSGSWILAGCIRSCWEVADIYIYLFYINIFYVANKI
jgi:hypothetical protein